MAGPARAAADVEEVRRVEVDDPVCARDRAVVVDHPLDAAAVATDDHRRAARQPHRRRPVVVERRDPGQRVFGRLLCRPAADAGWRTVGRPTTRSGSDPGVTNDVAASTRPAAAAAGSRGATGRGRAAAFAGIEIGWNAAGSTTLGSLGLREPASPGSATRASAAVSAALATKRAGRTIRARYDESRSHANGGVRPTHLRAQGDEVREAAIGLRSQRTSRKSPGRSRPGRTLRRSMPGSGPDLSSAPSVGAAQASRPSSIEKPARAGASLSGGLSRSIEPSNGSTS